jgi:hypothetical protein
MNTQNKFYMVKNVTAGGQPTKTHNFIDTAREEAKRLAEKHPGNIIVILETIEAYSTKLPEVIKLEIETIQTIV